MYLTRLLQFYKHRMRVPGQLYQGKNKVIPKISVLSKHRALKRLLIEQDNLDILSKPYLTQEETKGHTKERKLEHWHQKMASKSLNMPSHRYLQDELDHINCAKKWE